MSQEQYKRSELIDVDKESRLLSSALYLAFEPNSKGWTVDKDDSSIQTKLHSSTKRPIYRRIAKNESAVTFEEIYKYYQAGYKRKHEIIYNIDDDHDILYRKGEATGPISGRDGQYMSVRFKVLKYMSLIGIEYNIIGLIEYDIPTTHPLYIDPSKNNIRLKQEYRAFIYYQTKEDASDDEFMYVNIEHTVQTGGWIPNWLEDIGNWKATKDKIDRFHTRCKSITQILQSRIYNKNNKRKVSLLENINININEEENILSKKESIHHQLSDQKNDNDDEDEDKYIKITKLDDDKEQNDNNDDKIINQHPNIMDTNQGVTTMYYAGKQSLEAAKLAFNDINDGVDIGNDENKMENEENEEISPIESVKNQFANFLKRVNMKKYLNKFEENECCDMESIQYFDDDFLQNYIGINNKILRKKFLARCKKIKYDMEIFKNEYGINELLYDRLSKYGIVTMNILCDEIKNKNDLKNKYKIINDNQCNILWILIQKYENQNGVQMEGN